MNTGYGYDYESGYGIGIISPAGTSTTRVSESSTYGNTITKRRAAKGATNGQWKVYGRDLMVETEGKIGKCQLNSDEDQSNNYLYVSPGRYFKQSDHSQAVSFSAWVNPASYYPERPTIVSYYQYEKGLRIRGWQDYMVSPGIPQWGQGVFAYEVQLDCRYRASRCILRHYGYRLQDHLNEWVHVAGVTDIAAQRQHIYINGTRIRTLDISTLPERDDYPPPVDALDQMRKVKYPLSIMGSYNPRSNFHGMIDEVRIEKRARPAAWWKATYLNQNDPGTFYSLE